MTVMKKELKIGTFAVVVMIVSFFMINYLRGEDIFNREIEVVSEFSDLQGLVASAPVYIKGYKAGKVKDVEYDPSDASFNVVCSIFKDFNIPKDSRMTICSMDIMGTKGVRIDLGTDSEYVADGDMLQPASSINGKSAEIETVISNLVSLSAKLDTLAEGAGSAVNEATAFVETLNRSDVEGLVKSFNDVLESLQDPDGTLGKLFVDNSMYSSVEQLLSDIDSLIQKIQENPKKYLRISVF